MARLFNVEAVSLFHDTVFKLDGLVSVAATEVINDPELQPLAKEFVLSVTTDTVMVECQRYDGALAHITLVFDGEQFSIKSQGVKLL